MLSPESIVSPEAQQYITIPITIYKRKKGHDEVVRILQWGHVPVMPIENAEEYTTLQISQADAELIDKISWGNVEKIEAILSKYY